MITTCHEIFCKIYLRILEISIERWRITDENYFISKYLVNNWERYLRRKYSLTRNFRDLFS